MKDKIVVRTRKCSPSVSSVTRSIFVNIVSTNPHSFTATSWKRLTVKLRKPLKKLIQRWEGKYRTKFDPKKQNLIINKKNVNHLLKQPLHEVFLISF